MANELGPNIDRYPAEGGTFWLVTDRNHSEWIQTLRTKGDWPLAGPMAQGAEVARFNRYVASYYPNLLPMIVDRLNAGTELDPKLASALRGNKFP